MNANQTLELESESPADRAAKRAASLADVRERNRKSRAEARAAGIVPITIDVPQTMVNELDAVKRHAGLRSRSQAFVRIMTMLGAHPKLKQELGL